MNYYFTYGTSEDYPFHGGWSEVTADNIQQAKELFKLAHPCKHENTLNCADVYTEQYFKTLSMFNDGNFGYKCHEQIFLNIRPVLNDECVPSKKWCPTLSETDINDKLKEILLKANYGESSITISPESCDDRISPSEIMHAYNNFTEHLNECDSNFNDWFLENCYDMFIDTIDEYEKHLADDMKALIEKEDPAFRAAFDYYYSDINTEDLLNIADYQGANIDLPAFLDDNYKINLMFATEREQKYDMCTISEIYKADNIKNAADFTASADTALTYLIHQQKHEIKEVFAEFKTLDELYKKANSNNEIEKTKAKHALNNPSFVQSVASEINDHTYTAGELTALVTAKGQTLIDLFDCIAHRTKNIKLPKETEIGIFNEWNGSGSVLEITLEKAAIFPCNMVRNIQIEKAGRSENHNYTVDETYGLVGTAWTKSPVSIVEKSSVLLYEDINALYTEISNSV